MPYVQVAHHVSAFAVSPSCASPRAVPLASCGARMQAEPAMHQEFPRRRFLRLSGECRHASCVRYFRDQNGAHCHDSHTCAEATGAAAIGAFGSVLTGPDAASAAAMGGTDVDW